MVCEGGLVLSFKELTVRELDSVLVKLFKLGLESKSPSISHFLGGCECECVRAELELNFYF